jgi:hypothetical protein
MIPATHAPDFTRIIEVASRPDILGAGVVAGFWPSQTWRAYKRAKREGKNSFALPDDASDPRFIITRSKDRYAVYLHHSVNCPTSRVVCLTRRTADLDWDNDCAIRDAVIDFLKTLRLKLHTATSCAHVQIGEWGDRSVSALIIGADEETVRRIVDRQAGDNFRRGFATVVKSASGDQQCPH